MQFLALAGVLGVGLLVVGLTSFGGEPGATPAAAAALERLARIVAAGPSLVPGPGQYLYVRSVNDYPAFSQGGRGQMPCVSVAVDHRQVWIADDGSGLLRESTGPATFTSAADQARCQALSHTSESAGAASNLWFAAGCFQLGPTNDMDSLSTDPGTLLAQMRTIDGGADTPAEDFVDVCEVLGQSNASPAPRAALYRAAALIPGVELLGTVQDHLGRQGLGVALTTDGVRHELIFNSQTAALMGEQSTGSTPGVELLGCPPSTPASSRTSPTHHRFHWTRHATTRPGTRMTFPPALSRPGLADMTSGLANGPRSSGICAMSGAASAPGPREKLAFACRRVDSFRPTCYVICQWLWIRVALHSTEGTA